MYLLVALLHLLRGQNLNLVRLGVLLLGLIYRLLLVANDRILAAFFLFWQVLLIFCSRLHLLPRGDGRSREGSVVVEANGNELGRVADVVLVEVIVIQVRGVLSLPVRPLLGLVRNALLLHFRRQK